MNDREESSLRVFQREEMADLKQQMKQLQENNAGYLEQIVQMEKVSGRSLDQPESLDLELTLTLGRCWVLF